MNSAILLPGKQSMWLFIFLSSIILSCNDECETTQTFMRYDPIYQSMESFRDQVKISDFREIESPGKIYFKDGYLLINEPGKGIHVIDNRDIRFPFPVNFIEIPGNFDLAAQGNFLYADSYLDLLVFDITSVSDIQLINRQEDIFLTSYLYNGTYDQNLGVLVDYSEEIVKNTIDTDCQPDFLAWPNSIFVDVMLAESVDLRTASTNSNTTGIGGSMARFTIANDHLFTLDQQTLRSFDLTDLTQPDLVNEVQVGWGLETIFPKGDHLFLGAQNGMHIYNISDPSAPNFISTYQHVNSCDPVVVQDNYAYVTLRSGNACAGFTNQLDIIDISNMSNPQLLHTVEMQNPHGLGIDGTCLFICEGEYGLKLFDASNIYEIEDNLIRHYEGVHALDVIPLNNNLMMIGNDGLHQYAYNCNGEDLLHYSTIEFSSSAR